MGLITKIWLKWKKKTNVPLFFQKAFVQWIWDDENCHEILRTTCLSAVHMFLDLVLTLKIAIFEQDFWTPFLINVLHWASKLLTALILFSDDWKNRVQNDFFMGNFYAAVFIGGSRKLNQSSIVEVEVGWGKTSLSVGFESAWTEWKSKSGRRSYPWLHGS